MKCWDCGERTGVVAAVDDHRQEPLDTTFADVERCPYGPFDPAMRQWCRDDDARIRRQVLARRPADKTGIIGKLCIKCANDWRRYMKRKADCAPNSPEWTLAW